MAGPGARPGAPLGSSGCGGREGPSSPKAPKTAKSVRPRGLSTTTSSKRKAPATQPPARTPLQISADHPPGLTTRKRPRTVVKLWPRRPSNGGRRQTAWSDGRGDRQRRHLIQGHEGADRERRMSVGGRWGGRRSREVTTGALDRGGLRRFQRDLTTADTLPINLEIGRCWDVWQAAGGRPHAARKGPTA
jgi:hypothetical protein